MLFEGVKLMIVGMTTVMLFLCLMILFINLVAFLTKSEAAREVGEIELERKLQALKRKQAKETTTGDADEDIAVIAAAVAAYEVERFAQA
ncbi:MAG: oxaloacetate decarboxylase gamma subunit [Desulforhopalus sp.]|jgi:oxaloacetate decarboxylase gamma subunit